MKLPSILCSVLVAVVALALPAVGAAQGAPSSGIQIYIDPKTGEIVDQPVATEPARPAELSSRTRSAPAVEQPVIETGTTAAGGVILKAPSWTIAEMHIDRRPDGTIHKDCQAGGH